MQRIRDSARVSRSRRLHWMAALGLLVAGCGPPGPKYPSSLNADRPEHRIWAIRHAADIRDRNVIGILVDRLGDDDDAVRLYAILALERMTGTRLGYYYHGPETERTRAIERWRRYVAGGGRTTQTQAADAKP